MNSPVNTPDPDSPVQEVVFPPDTGGIRVNAIDPPLVIGHKLQNDGAQGINISMVKSDYRGLLAYMLPYLNMASGDSGKFHIGNEIVTTIDVKDEHFDDKGNAKPIAFYIPIDNMYSNFPPLEPKNEKCWFHIFRLSGNEEESPKADLCFLNPEPGEQDTDHAEPHNQGLGLVECSETIIDKTVVEEGLTLTAPKYYNSNKGDLVTVTLGPLRWEIVITTPGGTTDIDVPPEELATIPATDKLHARWMVRDRVHNFSGWSGALSIIFKPLEKLVPAPIIELADEKDVVHHDQLNGSFLTILVTGIFAIGNIINLSIKGFTKTGEAVSHTYSRKVERTSRTEVFEMENYRVKNLIGGNFEAGYELIKGGVTQHSKPAFATVSGVAQPLGEPTATPQKEDVIPVDAALVKVRCADYWPLVEGARAELSWQTEDKEGVPTLFVFRQTIKYPTREIVFDVAPKYFAQFPDSKLLLQCSITNPGKPTVVSDLSELKIGLYKDAALTPPKLLESQPLNPLGAEATVEAEFPGATAEHRARLVQTDAPANSPDLGIKPFDKDKRATWKLDRNFLIRNHGTTFEMHWNLRFKGERVASSQTTEISVAPIPDYSKDFPTPTIDGVQGIVEVKKLTAANLLRVAPWPGQAPGQARFLRFEGTHKNGTKMSYQALNGEVTGTEQGSITALILVWFCDLKDETDLDIFFSVILGLGQKPLLFPMQRYKVESLVELQPVITAVQAPQGEVPQNTETISTALTIHCRGSVNEQIEILVNGSPQKVVTTDSAGNAPGASVTVSNYDAYNPIVARAKYGNNLSSPTRNVILRRPLQIDTTRRLLDGYRVYTGWPETGARWPRNWLQLIPQYGVGQRTFSSSNPSVVSVDANGVVIGLRCGAAYIYVQDKFTTHAIYVDSINIYRLDIYAAPMTHYEAVNWMNSVPGSIPLTLTWPSFYVVYGYNWPLSAGWVTWMCDTTACPAGTVGYYVHGGGGHVCTTDVNARYWPWCLRRY
ncbi:hypothetical protein C1X29_10930 [Pseudomonas sp. GW456-12-10-14-LB2]|uniref:hypothetical protein n=1 Tax=Pseudomonas sp. GW456-12-10-14-LB2 TaxID=2070674 RepID=UPI000C9B3959|nr:hypothetical protein [Pseudomonas sp. GW456-12-10-14-LB2]PNB49939.1 hypothetical protein C1X29_10930 [Pseudomonas sp. GW456-12-10-14-LB2]